MRSLCRHGTSQCLGWLVSMPRSARLGRHCSSDTVVRMTIPRDRMVWMCAAVAYKRRLHAVDQRYIAAKASASCQSCVYANARPMSNKHCRVIRDINGEFLTAHQLRSAPCLEGRLGADCIANAFRRSLFVVKLCPADMAGEVTAIVYLSVSLLPTLEHLSAMRFHERTPR